MESGIGWGALGEGVLSAQNHPILHHTQRNGVQRVRSMVTGCSDVGVLEAARRVTIVRVDTLQEIIIMKLSLEQVAFCGKMTSGLSAPICSHVNTL